MPADRSGGRHTGRKAAAGSKRGAATDSDYDDDSAPAAKKPRKKQAVEPRSLPGRSKRVKNPGKPDMPCSQRSHEEVEAEKASKAQATADAAQKYNDAIALIAAHEAQQKADAAQEEANAVLSLEDLDPNDAHSTSDAGRVEDDDAYLSTGEFDKPAKTKAAAPTKRKKKPQKGETRAQIDAAVKAIAVGKKTTNSDAAAASKKAGLSKSFLEAQATPSHPVNDSETPSIPVLGGLNDEDVAASRPAFEKKVLGRVANDVMILDDSSSDVDETPSRAPAPAPARTKAKTSRAKIDKLNAPIPALKIAATPHVKDEQSTDSFSPLAAVDVKGLPALVGPTWDTVFIPAAMRALYCSPEPMTFMAKGESNQSAAAAVAAVQTVLDDEYPGNNLTVEWGDKICSRISARIRERRSAIGQAGVDAVDAFFRGRDYRDNPVATCTYAKWAARPDGPAFFKIPSPENSPRDPKAKSYIPGKKYMDTPLMIKTVAPFLKDTKFVLPTERGPDNKYDFSGMPIGLFALGGAGVERGVNLYTETGVRPDKPPKFSKAASNTAVAGFVKNIRLFTLNRWETLLDAGGGHAVDGAVEEPVAAMDDYRGEIYVPSSPM